jgi:hypothetical protein
MHSKEVYSMQQQHSTRYFLFPQSVMAEHEARHLALLLPTLRLLEIASPLRMPSWGRGHFIPEAILSEPEFVQRVKHYLRDYREFADTHQDTDTMALLQAQRQGADSEASRFLLQSQLRGRPPKGPDMAEWLRLEAASFLELARELDERELELEGHYRRMEELEEDFREILGAVDGEEIEEVAEAVNLPLAPDRNRLAHLLVKRAASWYRLFGNQLQQPGTVAATLTREVTLELLDPIQTEWERIGRGFSWVQRPVVALPSIRELATGDFSALWTQLVDSGAIQPYWRALAEALDQPETEKLWDAVNHHVQSIRSRIFEFCLQCNVHPREQVVLVMNLIHDISHYDLWKSLDRTGFEHLAEQTPTVSQTTTIFHLEWGKRDPV